jgi:hypothetical protein
MNNLHYASVNKGGKKTEKRQMSLHLQHCQRLKNDNKIANLGPKSFRLSTVYIVQNNKQQYDKPSDELENVVTDEIKHAKRGSKAWNFGTRGWL